MQFNVAVLPGDGIGPEVVSEGVKVLEAIGEKFGHKFNLTYRLFGGAAIDQEGTPLSKETLKICRRSDAVLQGSAGGPKWDDPKAKVHPADGLLGIRRGLGLFASLRPTKTSPMLIDRTNLKPEIVKGVDLLFVREFIGGLYGGRPKRIWQTSRGRRAVDSMVYSEQEIERVVRVSFELARQRRKKLTSLDKIGALMTSRLWRQVAIEVATDYPDVELQHMMIDTCAMRLIECPVEFDVIVVENAIGDILTDEAAALVGSIGVVPSACLAGAPREGVRIFGLYEPMHGSDPQRAGLNVDNPIATILSVAMMLRYSFCLTKEAQIVEDAVEKVLQEGYRTWDIMSEGKIEVGTKEMGDAIVKALKK